MMESTADIPPSSLRRWMKPAAVTLGLLGASANICFVALWWPALSQRWEPLVSFWSRANTAGFLVTVLALSALGLVCALFVMRTPRAPGLLLLIAGGVVVVISVGAILMCALGAVFLIPGGFAQMIGGALALSVGRARARVQRSTSMLRAR